MPMSSRIVSVEVTFSPLNDLVLMEEANGLTSYQMVGGDPFFSVGMPGLAPGYYEISIELASSLTQLVRPTLYVDSGEGFSEAETLALAFFETKGEISARIFLPRGARALRFDPSCQPGSLTIGRGRLSKVSALAIVIKHARLDVQSLRETQDLQGALKTLSRAWDADKYLEDWLNEALIGCRRSNLHFDGKKYSLSQKDGQYVYIPPEKPQNLAGEINGMSFRPIFSIIVPSYNTPLQLMEKLYESVSSQWYPDWELIVVDDASTRLEALEFLKGISDSRVKLEWSSENQGIAGATNSGVKIATGDYVVLLDHDDELTHDCLYELALCVNRENPDYIYSDEDKIDLEGRASEPHYKPDWSPDTMMSTMYVCHVSCIRRSLLLDVGGLRSQYDGCQDWDLVLRLTEITKKIAHIPKVLYHWRTLPGSVSVALTEKPYVLEATRRVRADAIKRRGLDASVEEIPGFPGYFGVKYEPRPGTLISIIIPTRDNCGVLQRCMESLQYVNSYKNIEIIIVDNGSRDQKTLIYLQALSAFSNISIIRWDYPFSFSQLCNIGAAKASGELILFLNDDTEVVEHDSLARMAGFAQLDHIGAVGAKLLYPGSNLIQHCGLLNLSDGPGHAYLRQDAGGWGYFGRSILDYNWLAVTGACLMASRSKFDAVGGFDETFPVAYNDVELCFRLREAGYYSVMCQRAVLLHHESFSRGLDDLDPVKLKRLREEMGRLYRRHPDFFQRDPFHNVNLHPNGINFDYAI
ncbi:glycosyl transferase family 2 [Agrobacterium sp. B131/95]|nr:glycosyl transferase family 2 [Agrobacterium sp. B131/95]